MCKLTDNCLGSLLNRAGIVKWGAVAFVALATLAAKAQPANDNFANATMITGTLGTITGSNVGATAQPGEPDDANNPSGPYDTVWYEWTSPTNGIITFNTEGSSFDTVMGVYQGSNVTSLKLVAANDDVNFPSDRTSQVTFAATNGGIYYISVDGYDGTNGTVVLNWLSTSGPSAGIFSFASNTNINGGPGYVFTEHETTETIIETHMTRNGARARLIRSGGSAGLVHVSYSITNVYYTNLLITNIFGTNIYSTNITTGTNFTNLLVTNYAVSNFYANANQSGIIVRTLTGCADIGTNSTFGGTTITITNTDGGVFVRFVTNYANPLPAPLPCLNITNSGYTTNSGNSNVIWSVTNIFCTNITITTNVSPSAVAGTFVGEGGTDYFPTNGVVDFRDFQMAADIPVYVNTSFSQFNHLVKIVINSVTLDTNELTNVIAPPTIASGGSNAYAVILSQESLGTAGTNACASTNMILNFDKAMWTCTRTVNGLSNATLWVVRTGYDANASGSVNYDIDFSPGKGTDNNNDFNLQPGSEYATPDPLPTSPPSSQPPDFTSVTGYRLVRGPGF